MNQTADNREATETKASDKWLLYQGVKSLLRCDDAPVVQGIAGYVVSQYRVLQIATAIIERKRGTLIPDVLALLSGATRFLEIRSSKQHGGAVWVARLDNERRAIEKFTALLPEANWTELKFRRRPTAAALSAMVRRFVPNWRRILRIARRLHRRHEFFKVFRVAELISYYVHYLDIFEKGTFNLAVVSSHSNPHGIAFNLAARKCGVPVVLLTHGMPVRPVAKLFYDFAVVHCEAARQIYSLEGCLLNRVFVQGRRQNYAPMPAALPFEKLRIGVFLCKDVDEKRFSAVIKNLLADACVSQIIVRPHPKNLWLKLDARIESQNDARLRRSSGATVLDDIKSCDIVLAGNSSVLIEAVTAGRPSGYISGLDYGSADLHEFVACGLIYPINDEPNFAFEAMLGFYQRAEWLNALRLFANIEDDESSTAARSSDAMRELTGSRPAN